MIELLTGEESAAKKHLTLEVQRQIAATERNPSAGGMSLLGMMNMAKGAGGFLACQQLDHRLSWRLCRILRDHLNLLSLGHNDCSQQRYNKRDSAMNHGPPSCY